MKTAWHQQYRGLVQQGLQNPEPREQFMLDLGQFLTKIRTSGADYILGWDANTAHDHNKIQDFLQDHDMVDNFTEFFEKHPPTHINGSKQIDLISVSRWLALCIDCFFYFIPDGQRR
jgi:phenylpropionate dioxygenase-like ring-hydroxylating dioxygenase large terminal subunit